jgi:hypothetical protein
VDNLAFDIVGNPWVRGNFCHAEYQVADEVEVEGIGKLRNLHFFMQEIKFAKLYRRYLGGGRFMNGRRAGTLNSNEFPGSDGKVRPAR